MIEQCVKRQNNCFWSRTKSMLYIMFFTYVGIIIIMSKKSNPLSYALGKLLNISPITIIQW